MIGCDFCEEWFHPECLSLSTDEANALTEVTWKCPVCDGKATIDYQSESNSTIPQNVKKHVDVNASNESETVSEKKSIESTTRLKVNVGPGEWLWLIGDQLVPPTNEEIVKERYWNRLSLIGKFKSEIISDHDFICSYQLSFLLGESDHVLTKTFQN